MTVTYHSVSFLTTKTGSFELSPYLTHADGFLVQEWNYVCVSNKVKWCGDLVRFTADLVVKGVTMVSNDIFCNKSGCYFKIDYVTKTSYVIHPSGMFVNIITSDCLDELKLVVEQNKSHRIELSGVID